MKTVLKSIKKICGTKHYCLKKTAKIDKFVFSFFVENKLLKTEKKTQHTIL